MKHSDIYEPKIRYENSGMLSGKFDEMVNLKDKRLPVGNKLFDAWMEDIDLQYLEIASTNIGFVKRFSKIYRKDKA